VFGEENVTTGASNDIKQATEMARRMITEFGFSDKLGPLLYSDSQEEIFLGHSVTQHKTVSDATAKIIDEEIRRLIDMAEDAARNIITKHRDELNIIGEALLEYETLTGDEVKSLLKGESIVRTDDGDESMDAGRKSSIPTSGSKVKKPIGDLGPEPQPGS
jgi:cell division protease FtsH